MKRLLVVTASLVPLAVLVLPAPYAQAQRGPQVTLQLEYQTPWLTAHHPSLHIRVRAVNHGTQAVGQLSLGIILFSPALSRTAYEQSLRADPQGGVVLDAPPPVDLRGSLGPGAARAIRPPPLDLSFLASSPSFVYPLKVQLRSDFAPVATLRTPVVFLNLPPGRTRAETPLTVSWTFVLDAPVMRGADGTFDAARVHTFLRPGGRLRRETTALTGLAASRGRTPADVVISPMLLAQLDALRAGYQARDGTTVRKVPPGSGDSGIAAGVLERLKTLVHAPGIEVSAVPYAGPDIPSLLSAGLSGDLQSQIAAGQEELRRVLGVAPASNVIRPPRSFLDQQSLTQLSQRGFDLFVLDPSSVRRPAQENDLAQPATASLEVGPEPGESVTAVVGDPGTADLLQSPLPTADPRLGARAVLGELAQIWLERPGVNRSVEVAFTEATHLPGGLFEPLVRDASRAPWLELRSLSDMAKRFPPGRRPATLVPQAGSPLQPWYVNMLDQVHTDLDSYRSMLAGSTALPAELQSKLFTAESAGLTQREGVGASYLAAVRDRVRGEFQKVGLETSPIVTLTSQGGAIPVGITSATGYPIRVQVELVSNRLAISRDFQRVEVGGRSRPLLFHVRAKTTGRFPVQVRISTPSGYRLAAAQLVVRSTAYNLVALIITIGAAVFLLAWWGRRFLPHRT